MAYNKGDRVWVRVKEHRTDNQCVFKEIVGTIIDAFNACDESGDHWQYRIKGDKGSYVCFYDGFDVGEIKLVR